MDVGGSIYPLSTQLATTTLQPRRITVGRHTGATRVCRRGTSKIRRDMRVGALYTQQVRFEVVPRPETRQELVASHLRPTPPERLVHKKTPQDRTATRRTAPHSAWRLHVQLRSTARALRYGDRPKVSRLIYIKHSRTTRSPSRITDGVLSHLVTFVPSRRPSLTTFGQRTQRAPPPWPAHETLP
jgi:hypothetical protein